MRAIVLLVATLTAPAVFADIQEGSWEITLSTSVEGMPGGLQPITQTRCISREDARDPSRMLGSGAGCQFENKRDTGSEITFNVACTGQMPMRGSGAVRYTETTVNGNLEITAEAPNQRIVTRSQLAGKRLGAC